MVLEILGSVLLMPEHLDLEALRYVMWACKWLEVRPFAIWRLSDSWPCKPTHVMCVMCYLSFTRQAWQVLNPCAWGSAMLPPLWAPAAKLRRNASISHLNRWHKALAFWLQGKRVGKSSLFYYTWLDCANALHHQRRQSLPGIFNLRPLASLVGNVATLRTARWAVTCPQVVAPLELVIPSVPPSLPART